MNGIKDKITIVDLFNIYRYDIRVLVVVNSMYKRRNQKHYIIDYEDPDTIYAFEVFSMFIDDMNKIRDDVYRKIKE